MTLLVDTSVWSLALRRDAPAGEPQVAALTDALLGAEIVVTTGLILQELLQGFAGPKDQARIVERLAALPLIRPEREDHIGAAELRNRCRRAGVQLDTIDALIAQLCIRHELALLTTDNDLALAAEHCPLRVWPSKAQPRRR
jgi:hypothetical protein